MVISNVGRVRKYSKSEVVQMYEGPKRRLYHEAQLSLEHKPLTKDDATVHQFGKFEKIDISKALRNINPRSPRYNLCLGQYLKKVEKRIFDAINATYGNRTRATVIKGFNADISAQILKDKWNQFKNPVAIGLDASKFDAHVSKQALEYEHAFYTGLFPGSKDLKELLKWQLVNNGVAYTEDGKVLFKMHGKRMSGDLNTSMGNCIIMCSLIWVMCKKLNIDCELANNGDDCVLFIESDHLISLQNYVPNFFKSHGFRMTVEAPVYQFEELEFCQTKPVKLSTGWRMVRNHKAVLTKDPMCLVPVPNDKTLRKWMHAVGMGGTHMASGVPVQQAFYEVFLRYGIKCSDGMFKHIHKNTSMFTRISNIKFATVTAEARVSYYYAFGILPDEQVALEKFYSQTTLEKLCAHPIPIKSINYESGLSLIDYGQ